MYVLIAFTMHRPMLTFIWTFGAFG